MKTGVILARFQPIHNGHLQLIKKACDENEQVLVIIGSIDKLSKRNPIPWTIRKQLVEKAIKDHSLHEKTKIVELADLSDESDNSHDWGFYLYSFIVSNINQSDFTIYYSDGFETITSWFPGFLLRNNVSLSLLARNTCKHYESFIRKQKMKKSLDEIEAGDEVYYTSRYYSKILKVDRVTSTTIVCGSEKFRKQNGRQIPADTWGSSYISVLTESLKNQYYEMIRKKQLITKIKSVDLFQLSVDSLQQISDVIHNSMTDENT